MKPLRIHYLQHVAFEGLGSIEDWAKQNNTILSATQLFRDAQFPNQDDFDWLIIMGGPMNIYQSELYPWLTPEKAFIKESIANDKVVLGICLGAQLIADVLGEKVYGNEKKEIGWFHVSFLQENLPEEMQSVFPAKLTVMHWHGDTFNIPSGASHFAESLACKSQGFIVNDKVIALQFHLETTRDSLSGLIQNCGQEITKGEYIQSAGTMLQKDNFNTINRAMADLLNYLKDTF